MIVLGIESSCDETAAAVVRDDGAVLSDVVASQVRMHAPYGGVVPELASRAHMQAIIPIIREAVGGIEGGWDRVDGIAVTQGPGLIGSLLVGLQVAKAIAWTHDKPIVGVDHLQGHLFAGFLRKDGVPSTEPTFPFVALLVSGGHTALYRVDDRDTISLLGQTRDDAAGEAFDKVAKLLGLGYPGGPIVDRLAALGDANAFSFPMPMKAKASLDFSFSGLKTAIARHVELHGLPEDDMARQNLCASFQRTVITSLLNKAIAACDKEGVRSLVITGGVAANAGLRAMAAERCDDHGIALCIPPRSSCTDNAAMIAYAGVQALRSETRGGGEQIQAYSRDPRRRRGKFRPDGTHVPRRS